MSDECCNGDRVRQVLSTQQWRVLRALLEDGSRPADPILRDGEDLDYEEYLTVCYEFHHVLLPELADEGLVEFDRADDEITRGAEYGRVRVFLERVGDDHVE